MKFALKYLKSKLLSLTVYAACFAVMFAVIALYRLPANAVLYAFLLSLFVLVPYAVYKCISAYRKYVKLEKLLAGGEIIAADGLFSDTPNIIEAEYQKIIKRLIKEKRQIESRFAAKRTDMYDYYTLWAHQIKTPIAAAGLLLQSSDEKLCRECEAELFKIEQYVGMVLGYLRLESESGDYVIKRYDVDGIVKNSVKKFSKQFILKKLSFDFNGTGLTAVTDAKWLGFVIEQIISNSLKYTRQGSVSVYAEGNFLCIKDTGIGIAPEDLPRVCEKGYTGYNGRTDAKSTGLGLYLCKRITEKIGHRLYIESEPGRGTVVKLDLENRKLGVE